ncbi:MAG: ABC transporter substrate-binding protein [Deltaproteobacteria bacterium]|nr:ABC transporter substrate-binding protein [Deltaproteobacteria bacterium]MBW2046195.1 ABC transporter substrate-binding protein [Deltaproteobacteria bacterium]MBW2299017.1 ABC transporter substrate-binding protein [Deltaproteobacteria bacterium]
MGGRTFCLMLLAVCLLAMPTWLHAGPTPGVTDTEVTIGITNPLSGPAAMWGLAGYGAKAWADYINNKGGIHGRKIKVVLKDDGYSPSRALANVQEMKGKVFAVTTMMGTAQVRACRDFLVENKILMIAPLGNPMIFNDYPKGKLRYVFVQQPSLTDEAEFLTTYAVQELGAKRLAIFYQNDEYGKGGGLKGLQQALAKMSGKAELVAAVPYEVTERALGAHALRLKESGADTLIIYASPVHAVLILKNLSKIGYRPTIISSGTNSSPNMFKIAGKLWEGIYIGTSPNGGNPGLDPEADRVAKILAKYESKTIGHEFLSIYGAGTMMLLVEGLKRAGRDLNTETMIKGMETIKDWKAEGMGIPITFGPNRRHGANGSRIMRALGGKYHYLTDWVHFPIRF